MQANPGDSGQIIQWLLEPENPPVRYRSLVELLRKSENEPEVLEARRVNTERGPVAKILAKQNPGGWWGRPEDFYIRSKYSGTVWTLILLAELGASPEDERIQRAADFILKWSQDPGSGGFAYYPDPHGSGDRDKVVSCLTGNMLWCLLRFGRIEDARVQQAIQWVTTYTRFDDGVINAPAGWPYTYEKCWGKHTCLMGVVKILKALVEIPAGQRSPEVNRTLADGAEFLLRHHIYRQSHALTRIGLPQWQRFGFPRLWDSDALEVLDILTRLGCRDDRMQDALALVRSKQDETGRWILECSRNGRMLVRIEEEGKASKWVTLRALKVLQNT